ncbi:MAG: binding-protein-dependent transporter inner membrane component [Acidobacteria bacterium OLB17]|nr:MAG: binding-protein-dependent transporter inner membrane component [Acidobacteria bacterium OLB17]MCZ2390879.1 ABC transporter permease [Acidobacteriota bacterium]
MSKNTQKGGLSIAAKAGVGLLMCFGFVAVFADFLAPYDSSEQSRHLPNAPISTFSFSNDEGSFSLLPRIFEAKMIDALKQAYEADLSRSASVTFFPKGYRYHLLGVVPLERHLFATNSDEIRIHLLGTDALGRDRFSRLLAAIRFSLIVCTIGAVLASLLGIAIGLIGGYSGKIVDTAIAGVADAVISLPAMIVILAARVAFPLELPPLTAAALLIGIFTLTGWAEMTRLTRGLVKRTRTLDYVTAARISGLSGGRILIRHILPNIARPLLTQATLILPAFLLAEATLSYLGVGLQEPEPSLGNMLAAANDLNQLREHAFVLLSPAIVIALFVLAVRLANKGIAKNEDRKTA